MLVVVQVSSPVGLKTCRACAQCSGSWQILEKGDCGMIKLSEGLVRLPPCLMHAYALSWKEKK